MKLISRAVMPLFRCGYGPSCCDGSLCTLRRAITALTAAMGFFMLVGCGGTPARETRASRERLNCIYAAQYAPGNFTPAERKRIEESCRR